MQKFTLQRYALHMESIKVWSLYTEVRDSHGSMVQQLGWTSKKNPSKKTPRTIRCPGAKRGRLGNSRTAAELDITRCLGHDDHSLRDGRQ